MNEYVSLAALLFVSAAVAAAPAAQKPVLPPPLVKVVAAPPAPATVLPVPVAERATEAEALALAKAWAPVDLRRRAEIAVLEKNFVPGLRQNPSTAQMLDAFPELGAALRDALLSNVDLYMAEFSERFYPRVAEIMRQYFTRDQVHTLTVFYSSPAGRHVQEAVAAKVDGTEIMDLAARGEEISAAASNRMAIRAGVAAYGSLSDAERNAVIAMVLSPAGRRFQMVQPKLVAVGLEVSNSPGPVFTAAAQKSMNEAFERVTMQHAPSSK